LGCGWAHAFTHGTSDRRQAIEEDQAPGSGTIQNRPATSMLVDIPTEVSPGRNQFSLATWNPLQAAANETTELVPC
jgi:hypothetical protein